MRIFFTIVLVLCAICAYSQSVLTGGSGKNTDGSYSFHSLTVKAYNYNTKSEVFAHTFNDTTSLKKLNELPFPVQPVFLLATIHQGVLNACTLWNNLKEYNVVDNGMLLEPAKEYDSDNQVMEEDPFSQPYRLSPLYTLEIEGNNAIFTFQELYGNSSYNFPLEGKLIITLTKD